MTELQRLAKRAQHRLWLNRFLARLGWTLTVAAVSCMVAVAVQRIWSPDLIGEAFVGWLVLGCLGASPLVALIWMALTRDELRLAATCLDEAAGLKERLTTGLFCETMDDPFAQAVVTDARNVSRGLSVRRLLPLKFPTSGNYAGCTAVVALLFFWLFPTLDLSGQEEERARQERRQQQIEKQQAIVQPVYKQQVNQLRQKYPTIKEELDKLDPLLLADLKRPEDVRQEPIKQFSKLGESLKDRREDVDLAKIDEFKKLAQRLQAQHRNDSLSGQLAEAMAKGDFKAAQEALKAMQLELNKAPKTPEEMKRAEDLKAQIQDLSRKLGELAESDKKNSQALSNAGLKKEQIERVLEQLQKKDSEGAKKTLSDSGLSKKDIEELMKKMQKTCQACSMANTLAGRFAKAAQGSAGAGQLSEAAADAFSEAAEQLSEMESLEQEMNQLASAMADVNNMKNQLGQSCSACNGTGMKNGRPCSTCGGTGTCPGSGRGGIGGQGQGQGGVAPEQATAFKTTRERTDVRTLPGEIISTEFVSGEQFSGDVSDTFIEAAISSEREVSNAIARETIPRQYHKSLRTYFDHSRQGLPADKVEAIENKAGEAEDSDDQ